MVCNSCSRLVFLSFFLSKEPTLRQASTSPQCALPPTGPGHGGHQRALPRGPALLCLLRLPLPPRRHQPLQPAARLGLRLGRGVVQGHQVSQELCSAKPQPATLSMCAVTYITYVDMNLSKEDGQVPSADCGSRSSTAACDYATWFPFGPGYCPWTKRRTHLLG